MKFLFWNVGKRSLLDALVALVESTKANILVLAEYEDNDRKFLDKLYEKGINYFPLPNIGCTRLNVFTDFEPSCFAHKREADRYSIREFTKAGYETILLALVHLPSKLYRSEMDQLQEAMYFRKDIELTEEESNNKNTIILGDFNMNPFESGMMSATAMHSLPCLRTAKAGSRVISGREHSFFYNPTWNLFGDLDGVPGTYFHATPSYDSHYWNMLDQVLFRPAIAERLDKKSLRIITSAGDIKFLDKNGRPGLSDHLPLFFNLELSIGGRP